MFSFLFNPFFILPMILVAWAQMRVRSAFNKYRQVASAAQPFGRGDRAAHPATARHLRCSRRGDGRDAL